nr:baseplate assembly protein [uncultured Lichenicoccus sp.]
MSGYAGQMDVGSSGSNWHATAFQIRQALGRIATTSLVQVKAVTTSGALAAVGFVDVQILTAGMDGAGNTTAHGIIHGLPYVRVQGGTNAIIIDPVVGDIGVAGFCSRDISSVKTTKAAASPGSYRRFSYADGIYLGGCLNAQPMQYIQFNQNGVTVYSPTEITLNAPTVAVQGNLTVSGSTVGQGNGIFGGIDMDNHVHSGVQTGSGVTGKAQG